MINASSASLLPATKPLHEFVFIPAVECQKAYLTLSPGQLHENLEGILPIYKLVERSDFIVRCSMLDVRCSMFIFLGPSLAKTTWRLCPLGGIS
jgi:hypothetical protein